MAVGTPVSAQASSASLECRDTHIELNDLNSKVDAFNIAAATQQLRQVEFLKSLDLKASNYTLFFGTRGREVITEDGAKTLNWFENFSTPSFRFREIHDEDRPCAWVSYTYESIAYQLVLSANGEPVEFRTFITD